MRISFSNTIPTNVFLLAVAKPANFEDVVQWVVDYSDVVDVGGTDYNIDAAGDQLRTIHLGQYATGITQLQFTDLTGLTIASSQGTASLAIDGWFFNCTTTSGISISSRSIEDSTNRAWPSASSRDRHSSPP